MKSSVCIGGLALAVLLVAVAGVAEADVNILWPDPLLGWAYTFQGDGDANATGAALDGQWHETDKWDGSRIGTGMPGGVSKFTDPNDGTTYIQVQDPGRPNEFGYEDPQNRKMKFSHHVNEDFGGNSNDPNDPNNLAPDWINREGVTISFRTRIATGDLDDLYSDGTDKRGPGYGILDWQTGLPNGDGNGAGYPIANDARGAPFSVAQKEESIDSTFEQRISFGILYKDELNAYNTALGRDLNDSGGLILNHLPLDPNNPSGRPDTDHAGDVNVFPVADADLREWREFWITIAAEDPNNPDTLHTVNVYMDGATEPTTFRVFRGREGGREDDVPAIRIAPSGDSAYGAFEVDFFSYQLGVIPPALLAPEPLLGDVNRDERVDHDDITAFLDRLLNGAYLDEADMNQDDVLNGADVDLFIACVRAGGCSAGAAAAVIPEPSTLAMGLMVFVGLVLAAGRRPSRRRAAC